MGKRKFVADGVFYAELNEFLMRTLSEDGYAGVEVRVTPIRTEIIIRATRTREVLGEKGRRIRELTAVVQKRYVSKPLLCFVASSAGRQRSVPVSVVCSFVAYSALLAIR